VFSISNQSTPKYTPIIPAGEVDAMDSDKEKEKEEMPFPTVGMETENDDYM